MLFQVVKVAPTFARRSSLALLLLCLVAVSEAQEAALSTPSIHVAYVSDSGIYLDAGKVQGIAVGARVQVMRNGEQVAELEVDFTADHSASCSILTSLRQIEQGDEVLVPGLVRASGATSPQQAGTSPGALSPPRQAAGRQGSKGSTPDLSVADNAAQRGIEQVTAPARPEPTVAQFAVQSNPPVKLLPKLPWARTSGSLTFGYQQIEDSQVASRSTQQTTARLSLRLRDLGGRPYSFTARLRARERQTSRGSDRSDRLSEFVLRYEKPGGRLSWRLGRQRGGTIGYIDGALAEFRLSENFFVGGFAGSTPVLESLSFESSGPKYGGFMRYSSKDSASGRVAEVMVAGIGEYEDGDINREYVTMQTRFGNGARWTLYQRAEIDLNRGWRQELAESSFQLSNLSLLGSFRFVDSVRMTLSYNSSQRFRTAGTRFVPAQFFSDAVQQSYRVTAYFGRGRGWNGSAGVSRRDPGTDAKPSYTYTASLYNPNIGGKSLLVGLDASSFTSESSDGLLITLRARKYFKSGHDLGLTLGNSTTNLINLMDGGVEERVNQYVRLSGTLRLPRRLFMLTEVEYDKGDDFEGYRLITNLGYRF